MNEKTFQKGQTFPGNQYHNQTNIIYPLFRLKSICFLSFARKTFRAEKEEQIRERQSSSFSDRPGSLEQFLHPVDSFSAFLGNPA